MNSERQAMLESKLLKNEEYFLTSVIANCREVEEAVFSTCSHADLFANMFYKALRTELPAQEAKAAFKMSMDCALAKHGMSICIHEFQ